MKSLIPQLYYSSKLILITTDTSGGGGGSGGGRGRGRGSDSVNNTNVVTMMMMMISLLSFCVYGGFCLHGDRSCGLCCGIHSKSEVYPCRDVTYIHTVKFAFGT